MMSEKRMNALMKVRIAADAMALAVNELIEVLLEEYNDESDVGILTEKDVEMLGDVGEIVDLMLQDEDFMKVIMGLIEDVESDVNKCFEQWDKRLFNKEEGD